MNTKITHLQPVPEAALRRLGRGVCSKLARHLPRRLTGSGYKATESVGTSRGWVRTRESGNPRANPRDEPKQTRQAKHPDTTHATSFAGANRRGRDPQQRERDQATATNKTPTEAATKGSHTGTETQRAPTGLRKPGQPPNGARTANKPAKRVPLTPPRGAPPPPAARQQGLAA